MKLGGIVVHSLMEEEDQVFAIYFSHFYSAHYQQPAPRVQQEQAIASHASREYAFRALSRVHSQCSDGAHTTHQEIPRHREIPSLLHPGTIDSEDVGEEIHEFSIPSQIHAREHLEELQLHSINKMGLNNQETGICTIYTAKEGAQNLLWRKIDGLIISIYMKQGGNISAAGRFLQFLPALIREELAAGVFAQPIELLRRTEDLFILLQTYIPNGYLQSTSYSFLRAHRVRMQAITK